MARWGWGRPVGGLGVPPTNPAPPSDLGSWVQDAGPSLGGRGASANIGMAKPSKVYCQPNSPLFTPAGLRCVSRLLSRWHSKKQCVKLVCCRAKRAGAALCAAARARGRCDLCVRTTGRGGGAASIARTRVHLQSSANSQSQSCFFPSFLKLSRSRSVDFCLGGGQKALLPTLHFLSSPQPHKVSKRWGYKLSPPDWPKEKVPFLVPIRAPDSPLPPNAASARAKKRGGDGPRTPITAHTAPASVTHRHRPNWTLDYG